MTFKAQAKPIRTIAMFVASLSLVVACGDDDSSTESDDSSGALREIHLGMSTDYIGVPGPWVADILGYYEEEGLDVTLTTTGGSGQAVLQLSTGQFDVIYSNSMAAVTGMDSSDIDLYPFFNAFYISTYDWVVPEDSDVETIADLRGGIVGVSDLEGGEMPIVNYLLQSEDINPESDVEVVAVGGDPAAVLLGFEEGRIDSLTNHLGVPIALRSQGFEVRSILPDDFEGQAGEGLITRAEFADDQDLLARIGRATAKAYLFCITNVDACLDVIAGEFPERAADRELARQVLDGFLPGFTPPQVDGRYSFGRGSADDVIRMIDLHEATPATAFENADRLVEALPDLVLADDEELLEAVNDFDYEAVVEQAEQWDT